MKDYMNEYISLFDKILDSTVSSLAKKVLQNVNEDSPRLSNPDAYTLHYIVAKLLWVEKRGRQDIKLEKSFLCTRLTKSTTEEKTKLESVLQLMKQTIHGNIFMGADT